MTDYIPAPVLARKLGLSVATLAKWRFSKTPKGPQGWIRFGQNLVAYPADKVEEWLASRERAA